MRFSLGRWRAKHLLAAWCGYWVALFVVLLWPALVAGLRMSQSQAHGSANGGISDGILSGNIIESGKTIWSGSITLSTLAMLVALPPLALWVTWLFAASRTNNAERLAATNSRALNEPRMSERVSRVPEPLSRTSIREPREES